MREEPTPRALGLPSGNFSNPTLSANFHCFMKESYEAKSFTVTSRAYERVLESCHLEQQDILSLPKNAVVVEIGSGMFQEFENGIKEKRPDVIVYSFDPTLSFDSARKDIAASEGSAGGDNVTYTILKNPSERDIRTYRRIQTKRKEQVSAGARSESVPPIHLKSQMVDLLVDSYGASLYLPREQFITYVKEIRRVLKPQGQARLFPIGCAPNHLKLDQDKYWEESKGFLKSIFDEMGGVSYKPFFEHDGLGVLITKEGF